MHCHHDSDGMSLKRSWTRMRMQLFLPQKDYLKNKFGRDPPTSTDGFDSPNASPSASTIENIEYFPDRRN